MTDELLTLHGVLKNPSAEQLERVLAAKADRPVFRGLGEPDKALRFMRASLRGSYLFGRFAMPSYVAEVFRGLTAFQPVDDALGPLLSDLAAMVQGELFTNNIFGRPGEQHAHYRDVLEAYEAAGGDMKEVRDFLDLEAARGFTFAIAHSPLWSEGAANFARGMLACCQDRLAIYILMPANEEMTPRIYPPALAHLCRESRFDKFRRYLEAHVELDERGHGPVVLRWLEAYVKTAKVPAPLLEMATKKVLALFSGTQTAS